MSNSRFSQGNKLFQANKLHDAVIAYQEAIEENPDFYASYQNLGTVLLELDRCEEAITAFNRAIDLNSKSAASYVSLGQAFQRIGRQQEAIAAYTQATTIDPTMQLHIQNLLQSKVIKTTHKIKGNGSIQPQQEVASIKNHFKDKVQHTKHTKTESSTKIKLQNQASKSINVKYDFQNFTYSRRSHFQNFRRFGSHLNFDPDTCNLKTYQDLFAYNFIVDNMPRGAKILEVGGGNSRVIHALQKDYEFWNLDKFEGSGNGPKEVSDLMKCNLVLDYIGNYNKDLPDNYFDCVFSISTLEHVPEDIGVFRDICNDIDRVLKPGGISMHCFDVVLNKRLKGTNFRYCWTNELLFYMFQNIDNLLHQYVPFIEMQCDPDLYTMSRHFYEGAWQCVTGETYEDFGQPLSYQVFWQKRLESNNPDVKNHVMKSQKSDKELSSLTLRVEKPLPKISIVTPSFNQGEFLEECIVSVISQNYPNLEYIVIDGGSTDNSLEIIRKYEKYITYWQSEPDGGHYPGVNLGFTKTNGEIMAWLNSDDKYHPDAFYKVVTAFKNNENIEWLTGKHTMWDKEGKLVFVDKEPPTWSREILLQKKYSKYIQQESTFWKRSLWEKAGKKLRVDVNLAADFELWLRFSRYAQLYVIDTLIGGFRYHGNQRSSLHINQYQQEVDRLIVQEKAVNIDNSKPIKDNDRSSNLIVLKGSEVYNFKPKVNTDQSVLITSLAPGNIENQQLAIASWKALGFSVVSLNTWHEIEKFQSIYSDIEFHGVNRHGKVEYGKPLIYIEDMLLYCQKTPANICGIINSDIRFKVNEDFKSFICKQAQNSIVFSSRIDIESTAQINKDHGRLYNYGFDLFFFDKKLIGKFILSGYNNPTFCLGVPWWDYWMPLTAIQKSITTKLLGEGCIYHVNHDKNYSDETWLKSGLKFVELFSPHRYSHYKQLYQENKVNKLKQDLSQVSHEVINVIESKTLKLLFKSNSNIML